MSHDLIFDLKTNLALSTTSETLPLASEVLFLPEKAFGVPSMATFMTSDRSLYPTNYSTLLLSWVAHFLLAGTCLENRGNLLRAEEVVLRGQLFSYSFPLSHSRSVFLCLSFQLSHFFLLMK